MQFPKLYSENNSVTSKKHKIFESESELDIPEF